MTTTTTTVDLNAVKSQAKEIVTSGTDIRPRLTEVVTHYASDAQQSGQGLVALVRAVIDGAREGFGRSVPKDQDDSLRQVVDALEDGLSRTALAAELTMQEAASSCRRYTKEDVVHLRDDLTAIRAMFAETVSEGLSTGKALTASQLAAVKTHIARVGAAWADVHEGARCGSAASRRFRPGRLAGLRQHGAVRNGFAVPGPRPDAPARR